ncbi:MAG: hypothetical protein RIR66_86 [Actinomycetota bacterium]
MGNQDFTQAQTLGQLSNASNATLLIELEGKKYIYKPQSGERQLWDFPNGTLYQRERAAYVVSQLLGWNLVPETVISKGSYGIGSFQKWVEAQTELVDIFQPDQVPEDWLEITSGVTEDGTQVVLAHANSEDLMKLAVFDAIINNADRKAGHILTNNDQQVWAIDHGVTFNVEPKLRTVLWGWLGQSIPENLIEDLKILENKLANSEITQLISDDEFLELKFRISELTETKTFPSPNPNWPAVPWPIF